MREYLEVSKRNGARRGIADELSTVEKLSRLVEHVVFIDLESRSMNGKYVAYQGGEVTQIDGVVVDAVLNNL